MIAEAVVFDFNGTLIDDAEENNEGRSRTAEHYRGEPLSRAELQLTYGMTDRELCFYISPEQDEDTLVEMEFYKERIYLSKLVEHRKCLLDGAESFLSSLSCPLAIASASPRYNMDFFILHFDLMRFFRLENIISGRTDLRGKPYPDYYIEAAKTLGVELSKIVVFEDSRSGIISAREAGAGKVIAVNSGCGEIADISIKDFQALPATWNVIG